MGRSPETEADKTFSVIIPVTQQLLCLTKVPTHCREFGGDIISVSPEQSRLFPLLEILQKQGADAYSSLPVSLKVSTFTDNYRDIRGSEKGKRGKLSR